MLSRWRHTILEYRLWKYIWWLSPKDEGNHISSYFCESVEINKEKPNIEIVQKEDYYVVVTCFWLKGNMSLQLMLISARITEICTDCWTYIMHDMDVGHHVCPCRNTNSILLHLVYFNIFYYAQVHPLLIIVWKMSILFVKLWILKFLQNLVKNMLRTCIFSL